MDLFTENNILQSRKRFLLNSGVGLGVPVLSSLLTQNVLAATDGMHHAAKAKRVIFLFMGGAPSHVDLFDHKPELVKLYKKPLPPSVSKGQRVTAMTKGKKQIIIPSAFKFAPQGKSGIHMSELLPNLSSVVDDLCLIKSMNTNAINHDPGGQGMVCIG